MQYYLYATFHIYFHNNLYQNEIFSTCTGALCIFNICLMVCDTELIYMVNPSHSTVAKMYNIVCFYYCNLMMADIASCVLLNVVDYLSGCLIDLFSNMLHIL